MYEAVSVAWQTTVALSCVYFCVTLGASGWRASAELNKKGGRASAALAEEQNRRRDRLLTRVAGSVRFIPMYSLLVLAMRYRAVSLGVEPPGWLKACVLGTAAALVVHSITHIWFEVRQYSARSASGSRVESDQLARPRILEIVALMCASVGVVAVMAGMLLFLEPEVLTDPAVAQNLLPTPVSPAVQCAVCLTGLYFVLFVLQSLAVCCSNLLEGAHHAVATLGHAPLVCVLFLMCRMRYQQYMIYPAEWAKDAMLVCTGAMCGQALLGLLLPLVRKCGQWPEMVLLFLGYALTLFVSASVVLIVASVYQALPTEGHQQSMDPGRIALPIAVEVTFWLALVYVLLLTVRLLAETCSAARAGFKHGKSPAAAQQSQQAGGEGSGTEEESLLGAFKRDQEGQGSGREPSSSTVSSSAGGDNTSWTRGISDFLPLIPMICVLLFGARLRAMELHTEELPRWSQFGMLLALWAVCVRVLYILLRPLSCVGAEKGIGSRGGESSSSWYFTLIDICIGSLLFVAVAMVITGVYVA